MYVITNNPCEPRTWAGGGSQISPKAEGPSAMNLLSRRGKLWPTSAVVKTRETQPLLRASTMQHGHH